MLQYNQYIQWLQVKFWYFSVDWPPKWKFNRRLYASCDALPQFNIVRMAVTDL